MKLSNYHKGLSHMSAEEFVFLKDLAVTMGMDKSYARKYAKKNGFQFVERRGPGMRGSKALALSREESDRLIALRKHQGFTGEAIADLANEDVGVFYVIQLVPELNPNRIKFGFAGSLEQRLAQHRTAAPTCSVLACWPCRKFWEQTVIAMMTADGCRLVLNEVYECDDVHDLENRGDSIFRFLPLPSFVIPLSDSSPLGGSSQLVEQCVDSTFSE